MTSALKFLTYATLAMSLGATLTGCTNAYKTQQTELNYPAIGQFVEVDGAKVHYVRQGSGPEVILIHGAGGNLRDFTYDLMGRLTDRYTVTAFDRPGHGYTDRVPGIETGPLATAGDSPAAQAALLRSAATKLAILDPIVVGHSFGGIVSLAWANAGLDIESPQNARAVVSVAGVALPWPDDLDAYYRVNGSSLGGALVIPVLAALATEGVVASSLEGVFAPDPVPEGYQEHLGAALILRPESFRANVRQVNTLRPKVVEMAKRYPELTIPIEFLHGTADTTVPIHIHARKMIEIVRSAQLTELVGVGHMPHHVDPQATVHAIDRAVSRAGLH